MTHEQFQELVSLFMDRELDSESEQTLFLHLGICGECRGFLRESVRLQSDLVASKMSVMIPRQMDSKPPIASNHLALARTTQQTKYARVRTFALLVLIVVLAGMFWSTTLPRQTEDNLRFQREMSTEELSGHQP